MHLNSSDTRLFLDVPYLCDPVDSRAHDLQARIEPRTLHQTLHVALQHADAGALICEVPHAHGLVATRGDQQLVDRGERAVPHSLLVAGQGQLEEQVV